MKLIHRNYTSDFHRLMFLMVRPINLYSIDNKPTVTTMSDTEIILETHAILTHNSTPFHKQIQNVTKC